MGERRQFKTCPKRLTGGGKGGGTIMKKSKCEKHWFRIKCEEKPQRQRR